MQHGRPCRWRARAHRKPVSGVMPAEGRGLGSRATRERRQGPRTSPDYGSEIPDGATCGSEASSRWPRSGGREYGRGRHSGRVGSWGGGPRRSAGRRAFSGRSAAERSGTPDRADGAASRVRAHDLEREPSAGNPHAGFDERGEETWSRWSVEAQVGWRWTPESVSPPPLDRRASPRLYRPVANVKGSWLLSTGVDALGIPDQSRLGRMVGADRTACDGCGAPRPRPR